ncbi:MAG: PIN domain-containing protein [Calothrix sp. MO_192.B10]|nr:PIN domain-containing protein [Calothrix sp. MO_192.B10]
MLSVVLDACVLFPMYLRDTLLSTAEAGLYVPRWSQKILDEAMGNLVLRGKISAEKAQSLEEVIKAAFGEAMVEVPIGLESAMTNHPKDRHVLAAAVTARSDIIVTNNLTDFDTNALTPWNITAQSPDDFLSDLFDKYPEEMVQVIGKQSQKYRRQPLNADELLSLLSKTDGANLPKFVAKIRSLAN